MFRMEKLRYGACKVTWRDQETARYPFMNWGLAARLATQPPWASGPLGVGYWDPKRQRAWGTRATPPRLTYVPLCPTPRDAGLTGGRLRLGINEGRHFPSVSKCGGLLDNLGFVMLG